MNIALIDECNIDSRHLEPDFTHRGFVGSNADGAVMKQHVDPFHLVDERNSEPRRAELNPMKGSYHDVLVQLARHNRCAAKREQLRPISIGIGHDGLVS